MSLQWKIHKGYGDKCYKATLSHEPGMIPINIYVYRWQGDYFLFAAGSMAIVFHRKLKKATNFKEAVAISQKVLKRVFEEWIEELK